MGERQKKSTIFRTGTNIFIRISDAANVVAVPPTGAVGKQQFQYFPGFLGIYFSFFNVVFLFHKKNGGMLIIWASYPQGLQHHT